MQSSDDQARRAQVARLAREHMRYARVLVHRFVNARRVRHLEDEFIGVAYAGLAQAAVSFDPERGAAFTTWAKRRIQGALLDEMRRMSMLSRQEVTDLRAGLPVVELQMWSLDELLKTHGSIDDNERSRRERALGLYSDAGQDTAAGAMEARVALERAALRLLTPRERRVLVMLYIRGMTLMAAGSALGVTDARICQIHNEALFKLRQGAPELHDLIR